MTDRVSSAGRHVGLSRRSILRAALSGAALAGGQALLVACGLESAAVTSTAGVPQPSLSPTGTGPGIPPSPTNASIANSSPTAGASAVRGVSSPAAVVASATATGGDDVYLPGMFSGSTAGSESVTTSATATPAPTPSPIPEPSATPGSPTATPLPPPTPTPRQKPPPSKYKQLRDYPRPKGDSGYGFHLNAAPYPPSRDVLQSQVIPLINQLGATWATMYVSSADVREWLDSVKLMVDSGFEVVVRYNYTNSPPHPDFIPTADAIKRFRDIGINYVVTGNEPNLGLENPSHAGGDVVGRQYMLSADIIKSVGCIPMLYPMSPGGGAGNDQDAHVMLTAILDWLKANDALDTLDGAAVAIHNRPHGKPLDVRDSTSFLDYEWIDDTVASYAGKHIPLIGTEAGYAFGEQTVAQYPRVDGALHEQYNMSIITGFRDARWRDSLFAQTFWILSGFGYREFISDWWVENPLNFGKDLPIVAALKAMPKFTRKFNEPGFTTRPK